MSGEFVTLADAERITGRVAPGPTDIFYVDLVNLQAYINECSADRIYIQQGINDNGTNTIVLTCYAGGVPVYHIDASGNQCVLEHVVMPPAGGGGAK
ncbi:MAG: hypothetical protein P4L41_15465 [Flavipsychrobacter sp.]|nr:hypothetical protein [Flavipsychrobacter sp.]